MAGPSRTTPSLSPSSCPHLTQLTHLSSSPPRPRPPEIQRYAQPRSLSSELTLPPLPHPSEDHHPKASNPPHRSIQPRAWRLTSTKTPRPKPPQLTPPLLTDLNKNRWRYFRLSPRAAWIGFVYAGLVPAATGYLFWRTDVSNATSPFSYREKPGSFDGRREDSKG